MQYSAKYLVTYAILLLLFAFASQALAQKNIIDCPPGTTLKITCVSQPEEGDDSDIGAAIDEILLCHEGYGSHSMLLYGLAGSSPLLATHTRITREYTEYVHELPGLEIRFRLNDFESGRSILRLMSLPSGEIRQSSYICREL